MTGTALERLIDAELGVGIRPSGRVDPVRRRLADAGFDGWVSGECRWATIKRRCSAPVDHLKSDIVCLDLDDGGRAAELARTGGCPRGPGPRMDRHALVRDRPALVRPDQHRQITNLLDAAWISVLLPVWARETGHGPAVIGLVVAAMSAASIVSSVLAAAFAHRMPRRPTYLIGFLLGGAPRFVVLALGAPIWLVVVVYVVSGFSMGFINPIIGAIQF